MGFEDIAKMADVDLGGGKYLFKAPQVDKWGEILKRREELTAEQEDPELVAARAKRNPLFFGSVTTAPMGDPQLDVPMQFREDYYEAAHGPGGLVPGSRWRR